MSESLNKPLPYEILPIDDEVCLRQLRSDEAKVIFDAVDSNRDYLSAWLPWVEHTVSVDDSEKFIADTLRHRHEGSLYGYAIVVDGKPAGHISLMHLTDGKEPEIGYWIDSKVSGRGITTKAANTLTEFGFDTLDLKKIIIKAQPDNIASNKIAEKLGCKLDSSGFDKEAGHVLNIWAKSND